MHRELGLFSISVLEKGRIEEPCSDVKDLGRFGDLESLISGSLALLQPKKEEPVRTAAPAQRLNRGSLAQTGSFRDQSVLQKLLQYRDRIPLSSRIIRTGQS